ncbi:MAG: hypothetical protein ABEJ40_08950 [Haloarculaceae archaeon]
MTRTTSDERGLSQAGMAAIGFAATVVVIAVAGGLLMQAGDSLSDGGPVVSATVEQPSAADGPDGQWVWIEHESGDTLDLGNVTVEVWLPEHRKRATLTDIPSAGIRQSDYEGNHVFTLGDRGIGGVADANGSSGRWSASGRIGFRIEDRRVDLQPGQTVTVTLRHEADDTRLLKQTVTVTE